MGVRARLRISCDRWGAAWLAVLVGVFVIVTPTAHGADGRKTLQQLERQAGDARNARRDLERRAESLSTEMRRLRSQAVTIAGAVQDHELAVARIEERIAVLATDRAAEATALAEERVAAARVLMALQRTAFHPPTAFLARPAPPVDTLRGALMLQATLPMIERRAEAMKARVDALSQARREAELRRRELETARANLDRDRRTLNTLLERKAKLYRRTAVNLEATAKRANSLANKAKDLRDLMRRLEAEAVERRKQAAAAQRMEPPPPRPRTGETANRRTTSGSITGLAVAGGPRPNPRVAPPKLTPPSLTPPTRPFAEARGQLAMPAVGPVVTPYGQQAGGATEKGITIRTVPGAQVVAPYQGRVVYAGPFRGYGQLLIIEHGERYHSLVAGLARIDSSVGQQVVTGEPVGVMGVTDGPNSFLYVELRRNGQPINPLPWLAARKGKVSG